MKCLLGLALLALPLISFGQCDPFFGRIVINEFMASNSSTASDENGEFDDWVELHNPTEEPINLQGYFLSDSHGTRTKFEFPDVVVGPGEYLIVWCDNQPEQGPFHTAFGLNADGEELGLYNPDTTSVDYVRYGPAQTDISIGRYPNGSGPVATLIPTFNEANTNSVEVGLVINEYMASNEFTATDQWGEYADWIELYNNSDDPIDLNGYQLTDRIGDPFQYIFPDTTIGPEEYMIIWCDQGLMEPGLHTFFGLGADGDDILLSDPDTNTVDYVRFGLQTTDLSEGRFPNGTGPFLCPEPSFSANNGSPSGFIERKKVPAFKVWPNPATDMVKFEVEEPNNQVLKVFNSTGRLIETGALERGINSVQVSDWPPGMYLFKIGDTSGRVIVE